MLIQSIDSSDRIRTIMQDSEDEEDQPGVAPTAMEEEEPEMGQKQISALDCSSSDFMAMMPDDCEEQMEQEDDKQVRLKVFQRIDMVKRTAIRCTAKVTKLYSGCGYWSHSYLSRTHKINRNFAMSEDDCYFGFVNRAFVLGDKIHALRDGVNFIEDKFSSFQQGWSYQLPRWHHRD